MSRRLPHLLQEDAPERLAEAATRQRDRLIVLVLLYCGLRNAELCGLQIPDLDLRRRMLKVRHNDFLSLNIVQSAQVSCAQFKFGQRIRPQLLDCFRWRCGLVLQSGQNGCFEDPLIPSRQCSELAVRLFRDGNLERHAAS
jgi:site-specific recombinase XerD